MEAEVPWRMATGPTAGASIACAANESGFRDTRAGPLITVTFSDPNEIRRPPGYPGIVAPRPSQ